MREEDRHETRFAVRAAAADRLGRLISGAQYLSRSSTARLPGPVLALPADPVGRPAPGRNSVLGFHRQAAARARRFRGRVDPRVGVVLLRWHAARRHGTLQLASARTP